jgi:oligopeptide/dipeptide ABC transporter ATP-binding protein
LIAQPDILISDEPVSALDVSVRAQVINLLRDLNQAVRLSQIFIAHDLWLTRYLSHDVVVLFQGQVMETGSCQMVFDSPRHPYTRALIEAIPYADPRRERRRQRPSTRSVLLPVDSHGCVYAPRCPRAQQRCLDTRPVLSHQQGLHQVACFYPMDDSP